MEILQIKNSMHGTKNSSEAQSQQPVAVALTQPTGHNWTEKPQHQSFPGFMRQEDTRTLSKLNSKTETLKVTARNLPKLVEVTTPLMQALNKLDQDKEDDN